MVTLVVKVAVITVPLIIKLIDSLRKKADLEFECMKGGKSKKVTFKGSLTPKEVEKFYKQMCD